MVLDRSSGRLCEGWRSVPSLGINPCFLLLVFLTFKVQFKLPYGLATPLPGTDSDRWKPGIIRNISVHSSVIHQRVETTQVSTNR